MGKLQSKHVCGKRQGPEGECILVNTQFGSSLDKLSDFDKISADGGWPDLSFDQSVWQKVLNNQEVSVCLKTMSPVHQGAPRTNGQAHLPLRVVLPPEKVAGNKSCRLLTMDQECNKKLNDSETTDDNNKTLNVEEFECGVSVAGSDKQEWSFTLYDFDGKGKITKEDLGSLLRSLYDAVGSSINLPRSGTKTLKLRLTVSPDNSKVTGGTTATTGTTAGTTSPRDNKNQPESNNRTKESKLNKDLDNSKLSGKDLKLDNISKAEQLSRTEQLNLESCGAGQEQKVHHKEVKNNLSCPGGGGGAPTKTPSKPKLTTVEQRHLAELVQKNMERHQQRQQQRQHHRARRHNSDHRKHHSCSAATRPLPACEESRDRRNYYLDLAGIENDDPTSLLHNTSAPADLLSPRPNHRRSHDHRASPRDAKLRSRSHNARRLHQQLQQQSPEVGDVPHARSRSYDVEQCTLGPEEEVAAEVATTRTRQMERAVETKAEKTTTTTTSPQSPPTLQMASTPNKNQTHKLRPVSLPPNVPDAVSPHHHRRHRNRERNRKLAMQQVAEWIEREHAWNNATAAAKDEPKDGGDAGNGKGATGNGAAGTGNGTGNGDQRVIVQRHEHHHVHEHHHHHHYHHYHET